MMTPALCRLDELGALRFAGPDARKFLQGQLSNDLSVLQPGRLLRAGLHNPQGRTLALLALIAGGGEDVLAILPHELLASVTGTLKRYVLRAKVQISDASPAHTIFGVTAVDSPGPAPSAPESALPIIRGYASDRGLLVMPSAESPPTAAMLTRSDWRALDIADGLPQVYQATSGQFVAQMLNLDCIDAISFSKGCYTGQEVVARAHYRGRVKRRMQRFLSDMPLQLAPGETGQLADGRSFRVVDALVRADGRCEFLAVTTLGGAGADVESGGEAAASAATAAGNSISAQPLPLPYQLPE
jgi:folate-binding protein YgfZ